MGGGVGEYQDTLFISIFDILDMDPVPIRLVLGLFPLSGKGGNRLLPLQLIPHQLVDPTHLKPRRYLPNSTPLLPTYTYTHITSTAHTAQISLLLQGENLNGNPQAILTAGPSKPRPVGMRLPLRIVQSRQHPHDSLNRPIIDLKLREKQGKGIERIQHAKHSYIGKESTQNKTGKHQQEQDLLDLLAHQHGDTEQHQHHRADLHYLIRKLIPSLEMIALAVVTIVTPIFIGGQVDLVLHFLDGYIRGELDVMLVLEASAVVVGLEDYLSTAALGVGLLSVHDLFDARDCGEFVLVWDLFPGGLGRRRVLGGFYAFGEATNSHAHFCGLLLLQNIENVWKMWEEQGILGGKWEDWTFISNDGWPLLWSKNFQEKKSFFSVKKRRQPISLSLDQIKRPQKGPNSPHLLPNKIYPNHSPSLSIRIIILLSRPNGQKPMLFWQILKTITADIEIASPVTMHRLGEASNRNIAKIASGRPRRRLDQLMPVGTVMGGTGDGPALDAVAIPRLFP